MTFLTGTAALQEEIALLRVEVRTLRRALYMQENTADPRENRYGARAPQMPHLKSFHPRAESRQGAA